MPRAKNIPKCIYNLCSEPAAVVVEGPHYYCTHHAPQKTYRCKHCGVQVVSKDNVAAVLGKEHKNSCPRSRLN